MADFMKLKNKEILDLCCDNADEIQGILNELSAVYNVPEGILNELSIRMFYQDYLYDSHCRFGIGKSKIRKYEDFKEDMGKVIEIMLNR